VKAFLVFAAIAVIVVSLYVGVAAVRGHSGYPLDDAWIHQTYARNWAETGQLAYVAGMPSAGSTAPLWTLLLSVAYRLQLDPYLWTMLLGALLLAISAWLLSRLAERLFPNRSRVSWLVGLACVLEWHLIWAAASGMETLLFIALALALIDRLWADSSGWIIGLLGGLLILTRPEGLLLFALVLAALTIRSGRAGSIEAVKAAGMFLIVLTPAIIFNLQTSGSIFPNTFYAKQSEYAELLSSLPRWLSSIGNMLVAPLAGGLLLLIPGLVWWIMTSLRGVRRTTKQSPTNEKIASQQALAMTFSKWLPLVWMFGHVAVYALRLPVSYQHGRYLLPIIPIVLLYGIVGTVRLLDGVKARSTRPLTRLLRRAYALTIVVVFALFVPIGAAAFATDVAIINDEMVAVAQWLDRNTPPDAIIAAHDIGAIGYFTRRPILDLAGLISPEVIPFIRDETKLGEWMAAQGANYFVTFPGWYPRLATRWPQIFAGTASFSLEHMTVYALDQ
jgi:hypothetical protein